MRFTACHSLTTCEIDSIVGIKDASGDLARGLELIEHCGEQLAIYGGEIALVCL